MAVAAENAANMADFVTGTDKNNDSPTVMIMLANTSNSIEWKMRFLRDLFNSTSLSLLQNYHHQLRFTASPRVKFSWVPLYKCRIRRNLFTVIAVSNKSAIRQRVNGTR